MPEEVKQKISTSHTGKTRPPFSQEWRDKISAGNKGKIGHKKTEEEKQRMSDATSKPIYCITNNTWYKSKRRAAQALNLKPKNIGACIAGFQKSTGGFVFSYHS